MKKKIFLTYIINSVISGFYILKGLFTIISVNIRKNKINSSVPDKIESFEFFNGDFSKIINFIEKTADTVQYVINTVNLYVYGYPPLFTGIIALALSSIGVFCLTKKRTKMTAGYYITIIFSFVLLGLLTLVYLIISGIIAHIKK